VSTLSTHVLDAVRGAPAAGIGVTLLGPDGGEFAAGVTGADGRLGGLGGELAPGSYRLRFDTGGYFAETFFPEITIAFVITAERHYHVPVLLSPFAYSTYRGS
jgi:5-hydroxyisourate hydrolase